MSSMHDHLWTLCRKLPSDFAPYGERDRDTAEPSADCSCGCRHFVPLAGELGNDWGICANAKSPRAGLLTFEHQGCPQFESEYELPTADSTELPLATVVSPPPKTSHKIKVSFFDFQMALENNSFGGVEVHHFLDTETGEIIPLCSEYEDYEELSGRIEADFGERYRRIEPMSSRESFRIMEDFAASLPESRLKSRLLEALSRNKPFFRFKDVLHSEGSMRDQWFAFRDDAHARYAREWLESEGIDAELAHPKK